VMTEPRRPRADEEDEEEAETAATLRGESQLMLKLLKQRTLILAEGIDAACARRVVAQLLLLDGESHSEPVRFFLDSPGGSVDDAFAIYDVMRFIAAPLKMIASGLAASAGVLVYLAVPKARRLALPNARFLLHQPSQGVAGHAADLRIYAQEILKTRGRLNQIVADETGQPLEKVAKDTDRDFWMSAAEAKEYGLVSRIVTRESELPK